MKRSEIERLIEKELIELEDCNNKYKAISILMTLEEAGMLPPCHGHKNKHKEDVGYYEWEPEDE